MDIIDIMLARAMTPQGKTEAYVAKAERAAQRATAAEASAAAAIETVEAAADEIATAREEAASLLEEAQEALETAQSAQINTLDVEDVDAEVKKLTVNTNTVTGNTANTLQIITTYPDNTLSTQNITKLYKDTGSNEDGTMTQKAITDALDAKADTTVLNNYATTVYVNNAIAAIPSGSGSGSSDVNLDFGSENEGCIVVVDENGNPTSGTITEDALIEALIASGGYTARDAVGLEIDYVNKTMTRTQQAVNKSMGEDFNAYSMYGGRMRCNVADDGTINAFYGDNNYVEDGSNGQVMIYQPKFYYQRIALESTSNKVGKIVQKDSIIISATQQNGFKLHPLFIAPNGDELDYVLLSAYEGGVEDVSEHTYATGTASNVDFNNDKMISIAGTKPITGTSGLSFQKAEQLAGNRGTGWHISTIQAESANQMLEIIEFGSMNGQTALGAGVCNITNSNNNASAITGATASLGNSSGVASSTTLEDGGSTTTTSDADKSSISYRGLENPWGNVWQMINGILINGDTTKNGGVPYICSNGNYSYSTITNNYSSVGFSLPNSSAWISALGYGDRQYDWLLMPAEASNATSALPIGDNGWFDANLNGTRMVLHGGGWIFGDSDGPFYYACDKQPNDSTYKSYGARLLYIPTKNSIYLANIAKWQAARS